jgi:hypothetical protein
MLKPFDNEARTRYYGKRIGDLVKSTLSSLDFTGTVAEYGGSDNNCLYIRANGQIIKWTAEHLEIIEKIEDIQNPKLPFAIGSRVKLSCLGIFVARNSRPDRKGTVKRIKDFPLVTVLWDGTKTPARFAHEFLDEVMESK